MADINGWDFYKYEEIGSTNDVIKLFCQTPNRKIVVQAIRQTAGRGRLGRSWVSEEGNLFFSMAFEFPLKDLGHLVTVSALSLAQILSRLAPQEKVSLKWPNDVLMNEAKISGILLEKGDGDYIITGIGVNIVSAPEIPDILYPTNSLRNAGIETTADTLLTQYLQQFDSNLQILRQQGFVPLKKQWLNMAANLNKQILVRQLDKEETGIFRGIDDNANLIIETAGELKKILAGDIFYIEKEDE